MRYNFRRWMAGLLTAVMVGSTIISPVYAESAMIRPDTDFEVYTASDAVKEKATQSDTVRKPQRAKKDELLKLKASDSNALLRTLSVAEEYDLKNGEVIIDRNGDYTISGTYEKTTGTDHVITVKKGVSATITLKGVSIETANANTVQMSCIELEVGADVTLVLSGMNNLYTVSNSGAAILYPEFALDMVRPGIITYGNAPSEELEGAISLRPMMSLHSMIAQVRTVPAGTDISYGRLYRTTHDTRVAVLPIGYADGLSRLLTGKASFYLQGKLVPVIGRICMDMCMLDVSEVPDAKPGDIVTIFGYDDDGTLVPCERLAAAQGTINYELLCQISKRIPRICHRGTETSQILQYIV